MKKKTLVLRPYRNEEEFDIAAKIIKDGGLVAFPTETVYGLGGDGLNPTSAKKIYKAKGRPSDNPLILHFASVEMIEEFLGPLPRLAEDILFYFSPGPVTVIVKANGKIPKEVTGGLDTVAVRIPANHATRVMIKRANTPIAGPSANLSGKPSPINAQMVLKDLEGKIDAIIDDGRSRHGLESTIIDCTGRIPVILRPGMITIKTLSRFFPDIYYDISIDKKSKKPKAPGMKYTHYAPDAPMEVVVGYNPHIMQHILDALKNTPLDKKLGVMVNTHIASCLKVVKAPNLVVFDYGENAGELGYRLYEGLNFFNEQKVDYIISEGTDDKEIGIAVMNRLEKAAGGNVKILK